jgi:trehalose 6-phosphate phosphatase
VYQDGRVAPPRIEDLVEDAEHAGLFLDFDGTLSEIAPTPEDARAISGLRQVLERLAGRYAMVAVVSGRPARQVAGLVEADIRYYGLYGLEAVGSGTGSEPMVEALVASVLDAAMPEIERAAAYVPGARVEHKGVSAAVHYRAAPDPDSARRVLLERLGLVGDRHHLHVLEGKRVVELVAGPRPGKGAVIERVAREDRLAHVLFAGDDLADLDAFAAVDRLGEAGVSGLKVAVRSQETPDAMVEAADVVVEGPRGLLELLERMAGPATDVT